MQSDFKAIGIKLDIQNYPAGTFFGTFLPTGKPDKYMLSEFENTFTYDADDSSILACNQIPSPANSYSGGKFFFFFYKGVEGPFNLKVWRTLTKKGPEAFHKKNTNLNVT